MDDIKVGIIGLGSIGQRHLQNLQRFTRKITVLSKRTNTKNLKIVRDIEAFIKNSPFDLIMICNETYKHYLTIMQCLDMKPRMIFVEKPICTNASEVKKVLREIKERKISLYVGYSRQFFKPYMKLKEIISLNLLGKPYYLRIVVGQDLRTWRKRDYQLSYSGKKDLGGSLLFDLIHEINIVEWILEETISPVSSVLRKVSNLEVDSEDISEIVMESKSGVLISIHQDFLRVPFEIAFEALGSKASLSWKSSDMLLKIQTNRSIKITKLADDWNNMFIRELETIFKIMRENEFWTNGESALRDIQNVEVLYEKAK